jgi:hypothetical protein
MQTINETICKAKDEVKELIKKAHEKQLEAEPGRTMMESFENRVNQVPIASVLLSLLYTPSNPNFKSFQESWRVKASQV